jgi:hypothetical protein
MVGLFCCNFKDGLAASRMARGLEGYGPRRPGTSRSYVIVIDIELIAKVGHAIQGLLRILGVTRGADAER